MAQISIMPVRRSAPLLAVAVCLLQLLSLGARAQIVLNATTTVEALSSQNWLPCGKNTPCQDPNACCGIWGVCGYTDRFCGQYCLRGACRTVSSSPPPPFASSPPPPSADLPIDPTSFVDAIVSVRETEIALAGCTQPGWVISAVENALYGDVANRCNSTLTYLVVSAACVGQATCMVPAVNAVFDDPCPNIYKTLAFGYRCQPEGGSIPISPSSESPSPDPEDSPSPSPDEENASPSPPPAKSPSPEPPASPPPPPTQTASSPPPPASNRSPPSPPPPPPYVPPPVPTNAEFSPLWGRDGELFKARSALTDFSQAGYAANEVPIPDFPVKYNVKDFGAKGDGNADDSNAFLAAVAAASMDAKANGQGVAVLVPAGRYKITKVLVINQSYVVLRGKGVDVTTLYYPRSLAQMYGNGQTFAMGGTFLTIQGDNGESKDTKNLMTYVTADIAQGTRRVTVETTRGFKVGSWYRLYAISPNTVRRRQLLSSEETAVAGGRRKLRATEEDDRSLVAKLFDDPALQAALNASFVAESQLDALVEQDPGRVPAQWYEPNATNPLGMDPWLLAAARYAAMAILTDTDAEPDRAPAVALDGTLDAYLYGDNIVYSGRNGDVYPKDDHVRFVSRVTAVGSDWIEFERTVPYDLLKKWKPVVHAFQATVQHSGFEDFTVEFPWSAYKEHIENVQGYNALGIYDGANCWMRRLKVVNADNGYIVNGADFVTVTDIGTDFTKQRGSGAVGDRNGHHGLWIQKSSNVIMTNFNIANWKWYHDISLAIFTESSVYSNGRAFDMNIDSHRGGTHHNLLSNLNMGRGRRSFEAGGAAYRGAHSAANVTWWNLYTSDGAPIKLPECDFGPLLYFAGNWLSPSKPNNGRRLMQADAALEGELLAPAPEAADPEQIGAPAQAESGVSAAASDDGAVRGAAMASTPNWCARQRWRVDLVGSGKQLFPADLAGAMVAARKNRRVFF